MNGAGRLTGGFLLLLLFTGAAAAQQWRVEVQGGRLSYETGPEAASTSLAAGVRYLSPAGEAALTAGLPLSDGQPVWGAVDAQRRWSTAGDFAVGLDAAASSFVFRLEQSTEAELPGLPPLVDEVSGWGATAQAMPLVAARGGIWSLEARSGVVLYHSASEGEAFDRTVWLSDGSVQVEPGSGLVAGMDAAYVLAEEDGYAFLGGSASYSLPALTVWGSAGRWLHDAIPTMQWSAGVVVPVGRRASIVVSGARESFDPVYATPARTVWGAGVSVRLGGAAAVAEPVPVVEDGLAVVSIAAADADGTPSIAGDFTAWEPVPMVRDGDRWVYRAALDPGVYNYAFVSEAGDWFVPEDTPGRRDDGMGGHVAVLVVQ